MSTVTFNADALKEMHRHIEMLVGYGSIMRTLSNGATIKLVFKPARQSAAVHVSPDLFVAEVGLVGLTVAVLDFEAFDRACVTVTNVPGAAIWSAFEMEHPGETLWSRACALMGVSGFSAERLLRPCNAYIMAGATMRDAVADILAGANPSDAYTRRYCIQAAAEKAA